MHYDEHKTLDYGHSRYSSQSIWRRDYSRLTDILVVVSVCALLVAILLPAHGTNCGAHGSPAWCLSNLRQIGQAISRYSAAQGGRYPNDFEQPVLTQGLKPSLFICPRSRERPTTAPTTQGAIAELSSGGHCSYIYVGKGLTAATSPTTIIAYEPLGHHPAGTCFLFADGTARYVKLPQAKKMIAELNAGHNPPRAEAIK